MTDVGGGKITVGNKQVKEGILKRVVGLGLEAEGEGLGLFGRLAGVGL